MDNMKNFEDNERLNNPKQNIIKEKLAERGVNLMDIAALTYDLQNLMFQLSLLIFV